MKKNKKMGWWEVIYSWKNIYIWYTIFRKQRTREKKKLSLTNRATKKEERKFQPKRFSSFCTTHDSLTIHMTTKTLWKEKNAH